jgi:hypothetical protein
MTGSIDQAAIGLGLATLLGASIGFERQWRQRMASNDQLSLRRLDSTDLEDQRARRSQRTADSAVEE